MTLLELIVGIAMISMVAIGSASALLEPPVANQSVMTATLTDKQAVHWTDREVTSRAFTEASF